MNLALEIHLLSRKRNTVSYDCYDMNAKHCITVTEIKTGGYEVGLTERKHSAGDLLFCFKWWLHEGYMIVRINWWNVGIFQIYAFIICELSLL